MMNDLEHKADQVGDLLSSTIASLAADARAIRNLELWKEILEEQDHGTDDHDDPSPRDTLLNSLHHLDHVVSTVERKVGILRQIVTEEQRALDHLERMEGAAQEQIQRLELLWGRCKDKYDKQQQSLPLESKEDVRDDEHFHGYAPSVSPQQVTQHSTPLTAITAPKRHSSGNNKENSPMLSSRVSTTSTGTSSASIDNKETQHTIRRANTDNHQHQKQIPGQTNLAAEAIEPSVYAVTPKPPPAVERTMDPPINSASNNNRKPDPSPSTLSSCHDHCPVKSSSSSVQLQRVTRDELESISRTVRGRVTVGVINEAMRDLEHAFGKKAAVERRQLTMLQASKQEALSNYHYLHASYETSKSSGLDDESLENVWSWLCVSEQELRRECPFFLAGEGTARTVITILKTLKRIQQVRTGKKGEFLYKLIVE